MTHFCISNLAVGVGKDDTAREGECAFQEFHRGVDVGHGQVGIDGLHTGREAARGI